MIQNDGSTKDTPILRNQRKSGQSASACRVARRDAKCILIDYIVYYVMKGILGKARVNSIPLKTQNEALQNRPI